MSIKAQTFAKIITNPMPLHKFNVSIPSVNYTQIVESTTVPSQGPHRKIELYYQGEKITYPGLPENGGEWTIKLPDSDAAVIKKEFDASFASRYNQKTGRMSIRKWDDIVITQLDLADNEIFSVVLHGCWIMKRSVLQLNAADASQAGKWEFTFVYQSLEDLPISDKESESPM